MAGSYYGNVFSVFMKKKLSSVIQSMKQTLDENTTMKILKNIIQCQTIFIKVLENPANCKLMEVLE